MTHQSGLRSPSAQRVNITAGFGHALSHTREHLERTDDALRVLRGCVHPDVEATCGSGPPVQGQSVGANNQDRSRSPTAVS